MTFETRYKKLNIAQQSAVDTIDGPVIVIAGPGTGKTELLSMRAANILKKTDTLPENILCLTFTDSGAAAMRQRMTNIIGRDAYKIAVHTFHSFCSDIISQHRADFYRGAEFRPADNLATYQIMRSIFEELPYDNPLATSMNDEFTHLSDITRTISELKKSGMTSAELLGVLDHNDQTIEIAESLLAPVFDGGISKKTADLLAPHIETIRATATESPLTGVVPLSRILADSLEDAVNQATTDNSTKPVTAWRNDWMEKSERGKFVLKARRHQVKLRATAVVYDQYLARMEEAGLYDFDDMILQVVHAIEHNPALRFDLQERYLYVMADEFQDTNLAQMRILSALADNPIGDEPNILVVGDDDQAVFSFQGADVGNIISFQDLYSSAKRIVLTDNYRSDQIILDKARSVISTGADRLENRIPGLTKALISKTKHENANVTLVETPLITDEQQWLVESIKKQLDNGVKPGEIAVLARDHKSIVRLLPALAQLNIPINYERRDNVLDMPIIHHIELLARLCVELSNGHVGHAEALLPEVLSHPSWGIDPLTIWQLSLKAKDEHRHWLEVMAEIPELAQVRDWLIIGSREVFTLPLEQMLDRIIGKNQRIDRFDSPIFDYYFNADKRRDFPEEYLSYLEALRTIRTKLRDYHTGETIFLPDFLDFIDLHRRLNISITSVRPSFDHPDDALCLMTAHKSKGLEFDTVYVIGAIDSTWGERVRSPGRLINYPPNLPLASAGNTPDERLRLFFVAMTRAKRQLFISYSRADASGKETEISNFLVSDNWQVSTWSPTHTVESATQAAELEWYQPITTIKQADMKELLAPALQHYHLSTTHVSAFLDVSHGGPEGFMMSHLLHFPSADTPATTYGRVMHAVLQRAHNHLTSTGHLRPSEDVMQDFETSLASQQLTENDLAYYQQKGSHSLQTFLEAKYDTFVKGQRTEVDFSGQGVMVGDARLTGAIDLIDVNNETKSLILTDYKTGKAVPSWKGKTDYEKMKLHKYRHQLLFYKLMAERSREYGKYTTEQGVIQFIEPTKSNDIVTLSANFSDEDVAEFERLIGIIWKHIITLDFPDISGYSADYKGMIAFEQDLLR
ncbi:MAG: ATP-dependent DNA helicase [Candidatus Saccharimonadales bacterium]